MGPWCYTRLPPSIWFLIWLPFAVALNSLGRDRGIPPVSLNSVGRPVRQGLPLTSVLGPHTLFASPRLGDLAFPEHFDLTRKYP